MTSLEDRVAAYVADHPGATFNDVCDHIHRRAADIRRVLRQEPFQVAVGRDNVKHYFIAWDGRGRPSAVSETTAGGPDPTSSTLAVVSDLVDSPAGMVGESARTSRAVSGRSGSYSAAAGGRSLNRVGGGETPAAAQLELVPAKRVAYA